ncbi:MAG TPA: glucoamylase family protein, partial [Gemmatimonadaceae bacterium]|nr:glucoamylase family protein [Gemmatimonadaceae bacterium]
SRRLSPARRLLFGRLFAAAVVTSTLGACSSSPSAPVRPDTTQAQSDSAFLREVQERTFRFFWETSNATTKLIPDRWPTPSFSSVAAVGFGLTAYLVGVERGWTTRSTAADRVLATLRFFWRSPQSDQATQVTGYRGFYYHFLDMETGHRFQEVELSTIDTGLLLMGVLAAQEYFDANEPAEVEIRALADSIYLRVDWQWASVRPPAISMGWRPENGFITHDYDGYNEAMFLYVLALGSPTSPLPAESWEEFTSTYRWAEFYGQPHVNFGPLFGHQYSHVWIDFRGIQDSYMRARGMDYFENSRRATLAQRAYAIDNPGGWQGYGPTLWGLTASDGPGNFTASIGGRGREFHDYWARGAASGEIRDDGTIAPTAVGGSVPFAPEVTIPALRAMRDGTGGNLYAQYGFRDAFNLTLTQPGLAQRGTTVPGVGWFDVDYLGIDQGPILLMIENHRTGFVWSLMRENEYIVRGLCRAGFTGGWLAGRCN